MKKTILIFLILLISSSSWSKNVRNSFSEQCRLSSEIFTGKVIDIKVIQDDGYNQKYGIKFLVGKKWKGNVFDTIYCTASTGICASNYFVIGVSYLVYSENGEIDLGSGRSLELENHFSKYDRLHLSLRYLFRRPKKARV